MKELKFIDNLLSPEFVDLQNNSQWKDACKFNSEGKIVVHEGRNYWLVAKKEKTFSLKERIFAILSVIHTLGLSIFSKLGFDIFSKKVIHLWTKDKEAIHYAVPFYSLTDKLKNENLLHNGNISQGQGEYFVFRKKEGAKPTEISVEEFEKAYSIFCKYSPMSIIHNLQDNEIALAIEKRTDFIRGEIKKIDTSLEIAFIPKTFFELLYLRKCIQEDVQNNEVSPILNTQFDVITRSQAEAIDSWYIKAFDDAGSNENKNIKKLAYKFNSELISTIAPLSGDFSHQRYEELAKNEIAFLRQHYQNKNIKNLKNINEHSPTRNFSGDFFDKPTGIRSVLDTQMILDSLSLECSEVAKKACLLFRGAIWEKDHVIKKITPFGEELPSDHPFSLSYGTSLFAGSIYDAGASAFYYMLKEKNAYVVALPFHKIKKSAFYVPSTNTLCQLFGSGEIFHGRTKVWKDYDATLGINGVKAAKTTNHLKSELTKEKLISNFAKFKKSAFTIK